MRDVRLLDDPPNQSQQARRFVPGLHLAIVHWAARLTIAWARQGARPGRPGSPVRPTIAFGPQAGARRLRRGRAACDGHARLSLPLSIRPGYDARLRSPREIG
jgi:hypothetical protein